MIETAIEPILLDVDVSVEEYDLDLDTKIEVNKSGNYTLQSKNITPTKSQQSVTPDSGYYGLSDVTVAAIPEAYQNVSAVNAKAEEVLAGKVIVDATGKGVAGTMPNVGAIAGSIDGLTTTSYTVPTGYTTGGIVSLTDDIENALAAI